MPIAPQFRKFYGRQWAKQTRPRILNRARNKCEQCHKPNRRKVWTVRLERSQVWAMKKHAPAWTDCKTGTIVLAGEEVPGMAWIMGRPMRRIRVVLTVAHLNHTPGDDRDENLKALCQWCHLDYDKTHHAETRAARKDQGRPLIAPLLA